MEVANFGLLEKALQNLSSAFTADCKGEHKDALKLYVEGTSLLLELVNSDSVGSQMKEILRQKCQQYIGRVRILKFNLELDGENGDMEIPPHPSLQPRHDPDLNLPEEEYRQALDTQRERSLLAADVASWNSPCGGSVNFGKVEGLKEVKDFVWRNVAVPLMFPGYPDPVTRVKRGILFYGLAGSGKTLLIRSLMSTVACPTIRLSGSDFRSCFNPPGCIRLKRVLEWAKLNQPCLICLDDLDVLCEGCQEEGSVGAKLVQELMTFLKDIATNNLQVTVVAGCLRPWYMSGKLSRYFDRRFHFALPDAAGRSAIFQGNIDPPSQVLMISGPTPQTQPHQLTDEDFRLVGEQTDGFTGADMITLSHECAMYPIRQLTQATHFHFVTVAPGAKGSQEKQTMLTPCDSNAVSALAIPLQFLNLSFVQARPITRAIVEEVLRESRSSVGVTEQENLKKWIAEFGQED